MPSSNAVDWPSTLPLPLVGPTRTLQARNEIHAMESGRVRVRKYYEVPQEVVDFEWAFTDDEYDAFKTFFEDTLLHGEYPFIVTLADPDDSNEESIIEYGFHEANYQWAYSDNVFLVRAAMIVEEAAISQIAEPFLPGLCGIVIWPDVSDGEGGGTTFECYTVGRDYIANQMQPAGTGINVVYRGNSIYSQAGEDFDTFSDGALVLGSPSADSGLSVMRYGDSPFGWDFGDPFDGYADSAAGHLQGTSTAGTGLGAFWTGNGP